MYYRVKSYTNKDGTKRHYLYLVETRRTGGRVRQITLANLGRVEQMAQLLPDLVQKLAAFTGKFKVIERAKALKNQWVKEYGPVVVFDRLWRQFGLDGSIRKYLRKTKPRVSEGPRVFNMSLNLNKNYLS